MPELEYAAIDADHVGLLACELYSQHHESSPDDFCSLLPTLDDLASFDVNFSKIPPDADHGSRPQPLNIQPSNQKLTPRTSHLPVEINMFSLRPPLIEDTLLEQSQSCRLDPAPRPFVCRDCGIRFLERRQLNNHKRNEHMRFNCTDCGKKYRHNKSLWQHRREAHEDFVLKCDRCNYMTGRAWNLQRHQDNKHPQNVLR